MTQKHYLTIYDNETCETVKQIHVDNVERFCITDNGTIMIRYTDGFIKQYDSKKYSVCIKLNDLNYSCRHL